jgi:hypothetical protein
MSTPTYFSNLPDLTYSVSINKAGRTNDIVIKDYFRLLRIRKDVKRTDTLYVDYVVQDGERPDQIAYKEYGEEQFYWMILQVNDITDYSSQWPLSYMALDEYILKKYGGQEIAGLPHHYETQEEYNEQGLLMIPGGMYVDETWSAEYQYDDVTRLVAYPVAVTNYLYETRLNNGKSQIQIVDKRYIWDIQRDTRNYYRKLENQKSDTDISNALRSSVQQRKQD